MDVSYNSYLEFEKIDAVTYDLKLVFDKEYLEKNSHAFVSFEMRREKQPDNALYSKFPDWENTYLKNYSVIGNSDGYGIGRMFIRFPFVKRLGLDSSQILDAKYYTYSLTANNDKLELVRIMEKWRSLTGNWNDNYELGERISSIKITGNEAIYNIIEGVKLWCDDDEGILEQHGLAMKSLDERKGVYNVFLTNDNSLYQCRTEITFN